MTKYTVTFRTQNTYTVDVTAESMQEAKDKVEYMWYDSLDLLDRSRLEEEWLDGIVGVAVNIGVVYCGGDDDFPQD